MLIQGSAFMHDEFAFGAHLVHVVLENFLSFKLNEREIIKYFYIKDFFPYCEEITIIIVK